MLLRPNRVIKHMTPVSYTHLDVYKRQPLGCVAFGKAGKPGTKYLQAACDRLEIDKKQAILLGDQLLTDCAAGKRFGIPAWIVPPIRDKKTLFFRLKRMLEKPYLRKYRRIHGVDQ